MEHVRNNPSIAKYTYRIEYLEKTAEQEEICGCQRVCDGWITVRSSQIR